MVGFNLGALTCASCKAFFRRNSMQNKLVFCKYGENCIIEKANRKCEFCRLKKCFTVGMKNEFITKNGQYNCSNHKNKHQSITRIFKNSLDFKEHELVRLLEVRTCGTAFCDENSFPVADEAKDLLDCANREACTLGRSVKFCKSFRAFRALQLNDQLLLLKHFCTEKNLVRGAFCCDIERDGFVLSDDNSTNSSVFIKFSLLNDFKNPGGYSIVRNFLFSLQREMNDDGTIRDLILSILLYKHRDGLSCAESIRYHYVLYHYLLRRHLEYKHLSVQQAKAKYLTLMGILKQIDRVRNLVCSIIEHFANSQHHRAQLDKVMLEVYDLK